jgi:hypothetical protein
MKDTFKLSKTKNDFGEYVIKCYRDGKRYPDGDYFTDDWADAQGTLKHMREKCGTIVESEKN